jgi:C-terminal processing protease CtpA/Prc
VKSNRRYWKIIGTLILLLTALFLVFISGYGFGVKIGASKNPPSFIKNTTENKPSGVDFAIFWQAWNRVSDLYIGEAKSEEMIYGAISGMIAAVGDPYTVFLKPSDNEKLSQDLSGQFEGIGAELTMKNEEITVVAPIAGSPA